MNKKRIEILDCTLRDGSYAIDYQFTAEDTAVIVAGLESAGVGLIEIGHGLGLGASKAGCGVAAATDEEYLRAARETARKAKFGMFCIPGIAQLKDLDLAAKYKMDFVRIGTNVNEVERGEPFVKKAKDLGMFVSYNLMKSYAVTPQEFGKYVKKAAAYGADVICVVDSAGGMLPSDVQEYVRIVKSETDAAAGFHGHDNLCLAAANSLEAVKAGATIVDTSLQGMGRSAGNAQTAIVGILLKKMGYAVSLDVYKALDLGEKFIRFMVGGQKGVDSISAILGAEQFHSSYLNMVERVAKKYSLDTRELVAGISKVNRIDVTEDLAEQVSKRIKPARNRFGSVRIQVDVNSILQKHKPEDLNAIVNDIANEMMNLSKKTARRTVFTLARTSNRQKRYTTFPFIRHNQNYIVGNAETVSREDALKVLKGIDGKMDFILIDEPLYKDLKNAAVPAKSVVLSYNDADAQIESLSKMLKRLNEKQKYIVYLTGRNYLADKLTFQLKYQGHTVRDPAAAAAKDLKGADFIIGLTPFQQSLDEKMLAKIASDTVVIDGGPGSISAKAMAYGLKKGLTIYRVDMRAGLFGEIEAVLETYYLKNSIMGNGRIKGVRVVSGGVIGRRGDVVVDSVNNPTRIIGVADGGGSLLRDQDAVPFSPKLKIVKQSIAQAIFS